jgi:hypothetical protein
MKKLILTILATAAAFALTAQAEYAAVHGTLVKLKTNPELLEELPNTPKEYLVIVFDKPVEVYHENWENEPGGKESGTRENYVQVDEVQVLYAGDNSSLKDLLGKKVIAVGEVMERNTAHHMAPILIDVEPGNMKAAEYIQFGISNTLSER